MRFRPSRTKAAQKIFKDSYGRDLTDDEANDYLQILGEWGCLIVDNSKPSEEG